MAEQQFQILVNGTLAEGAQIDQVKQNIASLFKTSLDKVEPMFSGRKMSVKKGLDQQTAQKYKAAINKAGLAAAIAPMEDGASSDNNSKGESSLDNAVLAVTGSILDERPTTPTPDIDTSDLVIGPVGEELVEASVIAEPNIDTSQLSIGEIGEDVVEPSTIKEPDIDISNLSMGEVGGDVIEYEAVPEAKIDISNLSMSEVGADVSEPEEVPPADINTSELSLDDSVS